MTTATIATTATKSAATKSAAWQGSNWIRRTSRLAIYARDGHACGYCGVSVSPGKRALSAGAVSIVPTVRGTVLATLDHVVPRVAGGSNARTNLVTCCLKCNAAKADRTASEFRAEIAAR